MRLRAQPGRLDHRQPEVVVVLHRSSRRCRAGSVTGLLGPSGCGKSTLMRAIVGVQVVAGGDRHVLGVRRAALPAQPGRLRHAGAVGLRRPDGPREPLLLRRRARSAGRDVDRVIDDVDLAPRRPARSATSPAGSATASRSPPRCSARPTARPRRADRRPRPGAAPRPVGALPRLADAGATLLVSSHVMDEAERCDRLLLMREGEVLADEHARRAARPHRRRRRRGGVPALVERGRSAA